MLAHLNVGYTFVGVAPGNPSADSWNYSVAGEYCPWTAEQTLVGELFATSSPAGGTASLQLGGKAAVKEGLIIDGSYTLGLNDNSPNLFALGFSAEF